VPEVDNDPELISNTRALEVIGRAMVYSFQYKFELAVKAATQMTSIFWILFLPCAPGMCGWNMNLDSEVEI
jgi:hypothetical protein